MRRELLDILRCPYCGGRLEVVPSSFHRIEGETITDAILACHCCVFPVVDGIPVMHLEPPAPAAKDQVDAGRPDLARRTMLALEGEYAGRFDAAAAASAASYRTMLEALGPAYESAYFFYRFSDPSYLAARPFVRAIARTVLEGGRAIDVCGGSGHLTRALMDLSTPAPVLADLYYAKLWLARRFTAPGCAAVCCTANAPLPFARGAFRFALCADAFMFIWNKRLLAGELVRLVDEGRAGQAAVITHTHNQLQWSPSLGEPLPPDGYLDLFETLPARLYSEAAIFADLRGGGPLDLSRHDARDVLDADPALMVVASSNPGVFARHRFDSGVGAPGELRINPLYAVEARDGTLFLTLTFPDAEYESEFGACRQYLPETLTLDPQALQALRDRTLTPALEQLLQRNVILDLPTHYY